MVLGIAAELSAPPSSPSVFRDLSLWLKTHRRYDVIALSPAEMIDAYAKWMRLYGLFDYVDDLMPPECAGYIAVEIQGGPDARLTIHNFHQVIAVL